MSKLFRIVCRGGAAMGAFLACASWAGQIPQADYAGARGLLPDAAAKLVEGRQLEPRWTGAGGDFRYETLRGGRRMVMHVDAATGVQRPITQRGSANEDEGGNTSPDVLFSPDGRWAVSAERHNLRLRDLRLGGTRSLTEDGHEGLAYGSQAGLSVSPVGADVPPVAYFSADSRRLLSYRLDYRQVPSLHLVQTRERARPALHAFHYPMPGDPVALAQWVIFDLESGTRVDVAHPPMPIRPNADLQVQWSGDGRSVFLLDEAPGFQRAWIRAIDAATGSMRTVLEESSTAALDRRPILKAFGDGAELLWSSERDGWRHLYRVDARAGGIRQQLTRGNWNVWESGGVLHVDTAEGWVYFLGIGREPGRDPYYRHLYRVRLDGSGLTLLTPEDADHEVTFSPQGNVFVDTYSRVDAPPVSVLRARDGRLIAELQRANVDRLLAAGWRFPERFTVKARDGRTDLYGVLFRPSHFDPARRYPVIDSIYPGPQATRVPKSFALDEAQALAELGFIVVAMDGMGTPRRSRAFREVSLGRLGEAGGLADHVAGLRELGRRHAWMDLARVGIYGHSAGGYAAVRAMLQYPEFYRVGVASAGNHDAGTYHAGWGERYQGYPPGPDYLDQANAALADNLQGKLLLAHGGMDDNVHPAQTLALAQAFIRADKDFDLLILPDQAHMFEGHAADYFTRRRWDYFVRHLQGGEPAPGMGEQVDTAERDAYLERALQQWHTPGMSVAVVRNDRVLLARGYGVRRQGESELVDAHTLFALGSTSKAFAAATLALLVDDGALTWETAVKPWLPWLELQAPWMSGQLNVRDLVTQRVGTSYQDENRLRPGSRDARDQLLRSRSLRPVSPFRGGYVYSNNMFIASGQLVEAVSGQPWASFARDRLWRPLGMVSTQADSAAARRGANAATPHAGAANADAVPITWDYPDVVAVPSGGVNSNAVDMAQWLRFQLAEGRLDGRRLLDAAVFRQMHAPQTAIPDPAAASDIHSQFPAAVREVGRMRFWAYGMGWYVTEYRGRKLVYHSGTIDGFRAGVALLPEEGLGVYVNVNRVSRLPMAIMLRLLDEHLDVPHTDWSGVFLGEAF